MTNSKLSYTRFSCWKKLNATWHTNNCFLNLENPVQVIFSSLVFWWLHFAHNQKYNNIHSFPYAFSILTNFHSFKFNAIHSITFILFIKYTSKSTCDINKISKKFLDIYREITRLLQNNLAHWMLMSWTYDATTKSQDSFLENSLTPALIVLLFKGLIVRPSRRARVLLSE